MKDAYPDLLDKPCPAVLCLDDKQFKAALNVRDSKTTAQGAYNIHGNALYFRNRPAETALAHELEHWAQAQRVGPDEYIDQLQSERAFREYEKLADDIASTNAHKLTDKY